MKHIEKNFENRKNRSLSDDEILFLNQFLKEQIENSPVECIYLVPMCKNDEDIINCSIRIIVVEYKGQIDLDDKINRSVYEVNRNMSKKRSNPTNEIDFHVSDIKEYLGVDPKTLLKWYNDKDLVSSYILFDRNGTFGKIQERLEDKAEPWTPLANITNIDELVVDYEKNDQQDKPAVLGKKLSGQRNKK